VALPPLLVLCALLFADGATTGAATTPLLLWYAPRVVPWQAAVAGGTASSLGGLLQMAAFRWMLAHERPWMRRFLPSRAALASALARYPSASFMAIVIARATPLPDAPVKLAAAACGYPLPLYMAATLLGSLPYYFALTWLGYEFKLPGWLLAAVAALFVAGVLLDLLRRRRADGEA
jgi:uncharacterized membrane protein YdjX (TVP38/TMEM64 family)